MMLELFTMTQQEKIEFIKKYLEEKNVKYKADKRGNIWGINFPNKVCFVSHMDTVAKSDAECRKPIFICDNILFKINAVLGADDTAGNILILNHIDKINFIFTTDEETGCRGAKVLAKNEEFLNDIESISGFIELDRKGNSDIIGYTHGYCEKDFLDAIQEVLTEHKDVRGVLTDIDEFIHLKPGVNISVGYYNAHSTDEILDLVYLEELNDKILELANIEGDFEIPKPRYTKIKSANRVNYSNYSFGDSLKVQCDCCGKWVSYYDTEEINGKTICIDCIDELVTLGLGDYSGNYL